MAGYGFLAAEVGGEVEVEGGNLTATVAAMTGEMVMHGVNSFG
jgi:hypothetical protein